MSPFILPEHLVEIYLRVSQAIYPHALVCAQKTLWGYWEVTVYL